MNLTYQSETVINEDYIRLNYREFTLTLYIRSMFRNITVLDFQKMCKVISWAVPDDEELIDIAEVLVSAITDSPRDDRAKRGLLDRVQRMLLKRGLDLYA